MTLTNRLTLLFLAALAVVLAAFSITLYSLGRMPVGQQRHDRSEATLCSLGVATELEPDGLEWDQAEHVLKLATGGEPTVWAVFDSQGLTVDGEVQNAQRLSSFGDLQMEVAHPHWS